MPVHLYGQPADMPALMQVAARHRLAGRRRLLPGAPGDVRGTAGRLVRRRRRLQLLSDEEPRRARRRRRDHDRATPALAARLRRLRNGGQTDRYHHGEFGVNSRLDEMQAAILRARLAWLPRWTAERRALAAEYRRAARRRAGDACRPSAIAGHVYHLFPILSARSRGAAGAPEGARRRDADPLPGPDPAAAGARVRARRQPCPVADRVCDEVLSLPLHPGLTRTRHRGGRRRAPRVPRRPRDACSAARCCSWRSPPRSSRSSRSALRAWGHSEAAPAFQALFMPDPAIGYRLRPDARTRFVTAEFDTEIAINEQGVRDDARHRAEAGRTSAASSSSAIRWCCRCRSSSGRRSASCSRIASTRRRRRFATASSTPACRATARSRNCSSFATSPARSSRISSSPPSSSATTRRKRSRRRRGCAASGRRPTRSRRLPSTGLRRLVRRSMVLQVLRLRVVSVTDRLPRLGRAAGAAAAVVRGESGAADRARGCGIARECVQAIASEAAAAGARTMIMLMPARFQVDDADYGRLKDAVGGAGRHAGARRRDDAVRRGAGAASGAAFRRAAGRCAPRCPGPTCSSSRRCTSRRAVTRSWRARSRPSSGGNGLCDGLQLPAVRLVLPRRLRALPRCCPPCSPSSARIAARTGCCSSPATTSTRRGTIASSRCSPRRRSSTTRAAWLLGTIDGPAAPPARHVAEHRLQPGDARVLQVLQLLRRQPARAVRARSAGSSTSSRCACCCRSASRSTRS